MPGGDRTGPAGYGPRTGRAAGFCAGYNTAGFMGGFGGRRGRCGSGGNWQRMGKNKSGQFRGRWWNNFAGVSDSQRVENLRQYADQLKSELKNVEENIRGLENDDKKSSTGY